MLVTFFNELTVDVKTDFNFGILLMVFKGRSTLMARNALIVLRFLPADSPVTATMT